MIKHFLRRTVLPTCPIGSDTSCSVTTASKSQNTFVKFDDLVSVSKVKPALGFVSSGG